MQGRSSPRLIADAFGLYRRYPLLFLALAAGVIMPFTLIEAAATGGAALTGRSTDGAVELVIPFIYLFVAVPLVSALHIHAVVDIRNGVQPRITEVARRGAAALPVVCAATIMSWLGIFIGLLLFLIPGIYLWVRWFVAAQTAAIEREGWTTALQRSWSLSEGHWVHVFVLLICVGIIELGPGLLLHFVLGIGGVALFLVGAVLEIFLISLTALAMALLYFDLRARRELLAASAAAAPAEPSPPAPPKPDPGIDPRRYSDQDRPAGWYVNPESPDHMRYWSAEPPDWHGRTRTPKKLRRRWDDESG
jgi:hypothetical protein